MAITQVRIHPALGVARVGNSPTDWFVGPERPWDRTPPPGGYKDAQCRVKRQAARFHLFADHDDGTTTELTAADADISWTVHLANRKAITSNSGAASDLTIDPGPRTLNGPDQIAKFDDGTITLPGASAVTVPLGEIRTDDDGHLLVLGGFGHSASPLNKPLGGLHSGDWYDDTSDGPVTASVTVGGQTFAALGAWVVVGPPKFGVAADNVVRLWDQQFDLFVGTGALGAPATPSYTNDIYPILHAATTSRAVVQGADGHHGFTHPITNLATATGIFDKLKPTGNMPQLNSAQLTPTQLLLMQRWKDGNFTNDWTGVPAPTSVITPDGLDKAALENAVGGAFAPGIEVGSFVTSAAHFSAPFRVDHATIQPGEVTASLSLPWQHDFKACGSNWWPVPRPNQVKRAGSYTDWVLPGVTSSPDMVAKWHTLGFVVDQGGDFVEVDRCDVANAVVNLVNPALTFLDVAQGPMGTPRATSRAIVFEVTSPVAVTLSFSTGPSDASLTRFANSVTVGPSVGSEVIVARLWVVYTAPNDHHAVADSVTVTSAETSQTWTIPITASSVPRLTASAALVLDKSGSMSEDRGDGQGTKHNSLVDAAEVFTSVMLEGDQIALVAFNENATSVAPLTMLGDPTNAFDPGRQAITTAIGGPGLNPGGATSIGDGIFEGRQALSGSTADVDALVVLTDGVENSPRWIADVSAEIDARTYAIGLGTAANTSAAALQTVSGNNGGYLLVTGPISGDNAFVLKKYFLQILSGISNAEVVLDPTGWLVVGQQQRIPFSLTETDRCVDVILLTDVPQAVRFTVETPNGEVIDPAVAQGRPGFAHVLGQHVTYYRLTLPADVRADHPEIDGTWTAVLEVPGRQVPGAATHVEPTGPAASSRGRLAYSLLVHAWSDTALAASTVQASHEPGATVTINATVTVADRPFGVAHVRADVTAPNGTTFTVALAAGDGTSTGSFVAALAGTYAIRVRASGLSPQGASFERERALTASVWHGGDRQDDHRGGGSGGGHGDECMCNLLRCIAGHLHDSKRLAERLKEWGIELDAVLKCVAGACRPAQPTPAEIEAAGKR